MPWRYYLDTSTFGGLVDDEEPDRVKTTRALFDRARTRLILVYTSTVTLEEITQAPESVQVRLVDALTSIQQPVNEP